MLDVRLESISICLVVGFLLSVHCPLSSFLFPLKKKTGRNDQITTTSLTPLELLNSV